MIHNFVSFSSDGALVTPPNNAPLGLDNLADQGFQVDDPTSPDFSFVSNIVNEMFLRSAADAFIHPRTRNKDINDSCLEIMTLLYIMLLRCRLRNQSILTGNGDLKLREVCLTLG